MWSLVESSVNFMHAHVNSLAQATASQYLKLDGLPAQLAMVCTVHAKRTNEQGAPFYAADADLATLRLSFATADVGKILEGVGRLVRAL